MREPQGTISVSNYRDLGLGLGLSVLIHILILFAVINNVQIPPIPKEFTIDLVSPRELALKQPPEKSPVVPPVKQQIVNEPQKDETTHPNPETRLLSEKDHATTHEQIKRGETLKESSPSLPPSNTSKVNQNRSNSQPTEKVAQQSSTSENRPKKSKLNSNLSNKSMSEGEGQNEQGLKAPPQQLALKLDDKTTLEKFGLVRGGGETGNKVENGGSPGGSRPFSRPYGSGAAFIGTFGTPDLLPNLPDGDLTLLNTKASKFAVFVRRVATQVFAQIRSVGWSTITGIEINQASDYVTLSATMSPQGDLIALNLATSSGSPSFDQLVLNATRKGAKDSNPPRDALASDGNIHFIFKSRSWAQLTTDPRNGAPSERRWIMLATGLE